MDLHAPSLLTLEDHLRGLSEATDVLARAATDTWWGARVLTCPDWDVLDLVAHQGMVHRWATAAVHADQAGMGNASLSETEGRTSANPVAWLRAGAQALTLALEGAAADLETLVFLKEAPPARAFWARRQCHETTIHALDALSAATGRMPTAEEAWFGQDLAADGIDELLVGFWQRGRTDLRSSEPYAVHVRPNDAPVSWLVRISDEPVRTTRLVGEDAIGAVGAADAKAVPASALTLSGATTDLYLALWNRGGTVEDPDGVLDRWREQGAITWA
ncbi:MAG: maleylpyruvate isomerase N-terminal domain-containing protein [Tetrasphaera sp.]|nr:maleylpyruvate isomerase N-terminal domain-containing protein [Tetrasphaera sp.]